MQYLSLTSVIASVVLAVGTGCVSQKAYSGSSLDKEQKATVVGHGVTLHKVNGVSIAAIATGAEVAPGKNQIELSINSSNYNGRAPESPIYTLVLNAEAGKEYAITGRRGERNLCAWPLDPQTGDPDFGHPAGCIARE